MYDRAWDVEFLAKPGSQPRRADALCSDDAILLQHDGFDAGARCLACGRSARWAATDDDELRFFDHVAGGFAARSYEPGTKGSEVSP